MLGSVSLKAAKVSRSGARGYHASRSLEAKKVLVIAEHHNGQLAGSTLNAVGAAGELKASEGVDVLVIGSNTSNIVKSAQQVSGVSRVLVRDSKLYEHHTAEPLAKFLKGQQDKNQYSHIVAVSSTFSKNVLPRLAALLDVQPISDVLSIKSDDTFVRPIYAGNALATVQSKDSVKILTVRGTSFNPASSSSSNNTPVEKISEDYGAETVAASKWISTEESKSERPELTAAKIVISGGRGMGNGDNFKILYDLADAFGNKASVGASRAAVDAGFVPNDLQVGQTGKIVAPEFYLAVGISGAIQHLAGMKDSKIIAAINKDEEAPIFQVADYGLVGDLFEHVPKLTAAVKASK